MNNSTATPDLARNQPETTRAVSPRKELVIKQALAELEIRNSFPEMTGLRTGIAALDEISRFTFEPGTLTVVGGTTGFGKTAFLTQLALAMASQAPVLHLILEDAAEDITFRMVSAMTGYDVGEVRSGFTESRPMEGLPAEVHDAYEWIRNADLEIVREPNCDVIRLFEIVRKWKAAVSDPFGVVIIDQLSHLYFPADDAKDPSFWPGVRPPSRYMQGHEKREWVAEAVRALGAAEGCATIIATQLNKERDSKGRPTTDSMRSSAGIAHKADTIMFLRDSLSDQQDDAQPRVTLDVAKARRGKTGEVELVADMARQRLLDVGQGSDFQWRPQSGPDVRVLAGRRRLHALLARREPHKPVEGTRGDDAAASLNHRAA